MYIYYGSAVQPGGPTAYKENCIQSAVDVDHFLRGIIVCTSSIIIIEGSLEAKLPTIWKDGKAQAGRNSHVEKVRREKIRDGESQKREDAGARKR